MKMASNGNRRIEDFFTPRRQKEAPQAEEADPPTESGNPSTNNEVCDPRNSVHCGNNSTYSPGTSSSTPSSDFPAYPDIAELTCDELQKDEVRRKLLEGEWRNSHKFKFPSRRIREKQRKLNHVGLANNKCLRYSISQDTVCCIYCVLFGNERSDNYHSGMFGSPKGVSDWANFGTLFKLHIQSATHPDAVVKGDHFFHVVTGRQKDIYSQISSQINDTVERNRQVLKSIIDVIILYGQQNLALRSHKEKNSNFLALLEVRAKTDAVLATHLASTHKRAKYTSPTIQNELIELCANQIRNALVNDCNAAPFYAFLADEATDSATMEEISICVRFVYRREEDKKVQVR